MKVLRKHLPGV